jgi:hypothetical protein
VIRSLEAGKPVRNSNATPGRSAPGEEAE